MKKYETGSFLTDQKIKQLKAKIEQLTQESTANNFEEKLNEIGALQLKIKALTQKFDSNGMDWHIIEDKSTK